MTPGALGSPGCGMLKFWMTGVVCCFSAVFLVVILYHFSLLLCLLVLEHLAYLVDGRSCPLFEHGLLLLLLYSLLLFAGELFGGFDDAFCGDSHREGEFTDDLEGVAVLGDCLRSECLRDGSDEL